MLQIKQASLRHRQLRRKLCLNGVNKCRSDQGITAGNFDRYDPQLSAVYLQRISHVTHGRMNPKADI